MAFRMSSYVVIIELYLPARAVGDDAGHISPFAVLYLKVSVPTTSLMLLLI
jgi:hypothetical protein